MVRHSPLGYWLRAMLFGVFALALLGCGIAGGELEKRKIEVLVETYFLPDASQTTVVRSFQLCDTINPYALRWISSIYDASSPEEVRHIFQNFQDSFNISKASPSWEEFESIHNKVNELSIGPPNPYLVKRQAAFLLAGYLHRFYLRNASTLRQRLKYLEPIYKRTMEGDIPDCVSHGKSTWHPAVYPMHWTVGIIIGLLLFRALLQPLFKKPTHQVDKKPIFAKKPVPPKKGASKPTPVPQAQPLRKIYAGLPSGNILTRLSTKFEPQASYLVIEINPLDLTRGKLSLVEDQATLLHAFSMIDTLRDTCELRGTGAPKSLNQLTKNVPGEAVLEEGLWKITKKIVLEWSGSTILPPKVKADRPKIPEIPPAQPNVILDPPLPKKETMEKPPEIHKAPSEIEVVSIPVEPKTEIKPPQKPNLVYARMPAGSTFYQLSDYFQPYETFFVLSISPDDPRTASISLVDDLATREYFLTHERYHQNICELLGVGTPTAENLREVEPGSAKLSNDLWIWKTSIKLDWEL